MAASKNQRVIIEELSRVGLTPSAIAGVMANLQHESSFGTAVNTGDGGAASGIAQWHPDRFARVIRVAKKMGVKPTDIRAQARTLALSIKDENQSGPTGTTTVESLNKLSNPAAVAKFFDENYERSSGSTRQSRMAAAKNYVQMANRHASGEAPAPVAKVKGSKGGVMTWVPKVGTTTSNPFGVANSRYAAGRHTGYDISGGSGGQPIRWAPPMGGKVVSSGTSGAYGNHVIIRDEKNREWLLAHMATDPPKVGTQFQQGDQIGKVGNTGNSDGAHLHIEMTAPLAKGEHWSYNEVKQPKLKFKVGSNGQTYDENFKPVGDDFMDVVGLSGQALKRPGNEDLQALVDQATQEEWTTEEFRRRLKKTDWYVARAQSQREFDMMQDTEQQQKIAQTKAEARQAATTLGVNLSKEDLRKLSVRMARDGYNNQQVQWFLGRRYKPSTEPGGESGTALATQEALKQKARDYGVRLDSSVLTKWTQDVLQKGTSVESFNDDIMGFATTQNPNLKDAYARGLTTREALQSYINTAANMMGVTEDQIDLTDPKWRNVFNPDGTMKSDEQWQTDIRKNGAYGYGNTTNAVMEARRHGRNMMRTMGVFSNG